MAKDGIVLYNSFTGYTKRYAEYLAETLDYAIKPIQKANLFNVSTYPTIIFGGPLHHNRIEGISGIIDGCSYFGEQNLIVFSVGIASLNADLEKQIKMRNCGDLPVESFLYQALPGGLSYKDCQPRAESLQHRRLRHHHRSRPQRRPLRFDHAHIAAHIPDLKTTTPAAWNPRLRAFFMHGVSHETFASDPRAQVRGASGTPGRSPCRPCGQCRAEARSQSYREWCSSPG